MDFMLQAHGAKMIFPLPEGLRELTSDIAREVLRAQPSNMYVFIADYCDILVKTRETALAAAELIDRIVTQDVTFEALLQKRGITLQEAHHASTIIQAAFRGFHTRKTLPKREKAQDPFIKELGVDLELINHAVTTIQAAFKGFVVRKAVFGLSPDRRQPVSYIVRDILQKCNVNMEEANAAATRIQKVFRGFSVRKSLRKNQEWEGEGELEPEKSNIAEESSLVNTECQQVEEEEYKVFADVPSHVDSSVEGAEEQTTEDDGYPSSTELVDSSTDNSSDED